MTRLDWTYDRNGEHVARHKGLVLRAVHDDSPGNPFEDWDGHWPMIVRYDRYSTVYDKAAGAGAGVDEPADRFGDALLVHLQHHIAKVFGESVQTLLEAHCSSENWPVDEDGYDVVPRHCFDPELLREAFEWELGEIPRSKRLDVLAELYELLDIPCLRTTSRGCSQGDYAELLIVATPEAQKELRPRPEGMTDEEWRKVLEADMQAQADLYGAWAWGDVYGYIVCRPVTDEDGEEELEEHDSCWGFYGSDFGESGLEDAAIEAAEAHVATTVPEPTH